MGGCINTGSVILGGGVAGLSLAAFLKRKTLILEKQPIVGGLSRSYQLDGVSYDIGPHIIFSKNKEVLDLHTSMIETNQVRRSNKVVYKGRFVKYPFENGLGDLPPADRDFCLREFLNNPYEKYQPRNMLQFFLKTFGEGITHSYLQPYNEKIWKFDPSCMDLQMVERIPKPPKEDVIASANGVETEGYKHQLYFHYPCAGGFQTLVDAYEKRALERSEIRTNVRIQALSKSSGKWRIETDSGAIVADTLINCIPLAELFAVLPEPPEEIQSALKALLFNSIHVVAVHVRRDAIGNQLALYIPNPDIIFHRLTKLNFLGGNYAREGEASTLMAEVTFRPGSYLSTLTREQVEQRVIDDMQAIGFIRKADVVSAELRTERYGYVIYDLGHRRNVDRVLEYLQSLGIDCVGRFAEWEYLNTDGVVEHAMKLAARLNGER